MGVTRGAHSALSAAQGERASSAIVAAQRMSGAEPTPEDVALGEKVLAREISADEAIEARLAQIEAKYGVSR